MLKCLFGGMSIAWDIAEFVQEKMNRRGDGGHLSFTIRRVDFSRTPDHEQAERVEWSRLDELSTVL